MVNFVAKSVTDKGGNTFIEVTQTNDDGSSVVRTLDIDDFLDAMGKSVSKEVELIPIKKDFFPKDYLSLDFGNYSNYRCSFIVEPKKRVFVFSNGKHYLIPYPRLLFQVSRQGQYRMNGKVFAIKSRGKKLFQYPFGNVSADGHICMGNIDLENVQSIEDFAEEFFLGVTNSDYVGTSSRVKPGYNQGQLLEKLVQLDEFPEKWLVPSGVNYDSIVRSA